MSAERLRLLQEVGAELDTGASLGAAIFRARDDATAGLEARIEKALQELAGNGSTPATARATEGMEGGRNSRLPSSVASHGITGHLHLLVL